MLKQKYFLTDFFILSAEKQPIKSSWRNIEWLPKKIHSKVNYLINFSVIFANNRNNIRYCGSKACQN